MSNLKRNHILTMQLKVVEVIKAAKLLLQELEEIKKAMDS
jgi:hypothetical protein